MRPEIYLLYKLVLEQGFTISDIYDMCNDRFTVKTVPYLGLYSVTGSYPGPRERMRIWMFRMLMDRKIDIFQAYINEVSTNELADFIAIHATDAINLTWWDKIFTLIKRWFNVE